MNSVNRILISIFMVATSYGLFTPAPAQAASSTVSIQLTEKGTSSESAGPAVCAHSFAGDGLMAGTSVYVAFYDRKALVGTYQLGTTGFDGHLDPTFEFNTIESSFVPSGTIKAVFSYTEYGAAIDTIAYKVRCP